MKLEFSSIKNGTIFPDSFQHLNEENGTIEFKHMQGAGGLAVVYAPNGTGKSSFANVLRTTTASDYISFSATDENGSPITPESGLFHVVQDQLNRNIIQGKETDYLVGEQIRREYDLKDQINSLYNTALANLNLKYKNDYKVTKVGDFLLTRIGTVDEYVRPRLYIRDLVKTQSKGKGINQEEFIAYIRDDENKPSLVDLDNEKRQFVINDCHSKKIVEVIINLNHQAITSDPQVVQIERHDDAIKLLNKYHDLDTCVVCDNHDFDGNSILTRKTENRQHIYESLDQATKDLLDKVIKDDSLELSDPFEIKNTIRAFISGEDSVEILQLQDELRAYVYAIGNEMIEELFHCFDESGFFQKYDEYYALTQINPQLDNEEILFIQEIISENIGKDITIERDESSRNYKLKIGGKDLIGVNPKDLQLSAGEQNFISLSFDLLFARRSNSPYVVLDDPISSFDSVYKNKIAFCIIKFLEDKKQIVLTHNTDLIRLLNVQKNNSFNLYILSRAEDGQNGFIPVNQQEKQLLINLHELVKLFQNNTNQQGENVSLYDAIGNRRDFLMAMIPFMRGYANIVRDPNHYYNQLSGIMHGYERGSLDVVPIYNELFGYDFGGQEVISTSDILNIDCNALDIIDEESFPLLSETLRQTLVYYHLRMKVEKELTDLFPMRTDDNPMLSQVISRAFNAERNNPDFEIKRRFRVFLNSRKTLLNEFNHFEGNLNIFQPAIDITPEALDKEIRDIEAKLSEIRTFASESNNNIHKSEHRL